jgi:hypothetical protein
MSTWARAIAHRRHQRALRLVVMQLSPFQERIEPVKGDRSLSKGSVNCVYQSVMVTSTPGRQSDRAHHSLRLIGQGQRSMAESANQKQNR